MKEEMLAPLSNVFPILMLQLATASTDDNSKEMPLLPTHGGLHTILEDTVSPAFGATVIIIVTVVISGSAYLCFLKYICSGCCKATQVVPVRRLDPSKSEEQV